jgi:DNA-binding transcriptional LysR family regulator
MDTLAGMRTFVAVVTHGSFTAAADQLGVSKALASKYVATLEARLGTRLLNRSTRTLHTTEAGRAYYDRCRKILEEVDELEGALLAGRKEPRGHLAIAAPQSFGDSFVADAAARFMRDYPQVTIDVHFADRYVNVVEEGFDLAIRVGALEDSSLVSQRLGAVRLIACAAPGYLAAHGTPRRPEDLGDHECVRDRNFRLGAKWPFARKGRELEIAITGPLVVNGIMATHQATLAGAGIGLLAAHLVAADLESDRLVRVLEAYEAPELPINAVYPHRQYLAAKVQKFVEFLRARLADYGLGPAAASTPPKKRATSGAGSRRRPA